MSVEKLEAAKKLEAKSGGWRAQALQLAAVVLAVFVAKGALAEPFYVPSGSMVVMNSIPVRSSRLPMNALTFGNMLCEMLRGG